MKDRIKKVRENSKKNQEQFAESLNLSRTFVNLIENGKKIPSERTIKDICLKYGVNYDWLVYGDGDMFKEESAIKEIVRSIVPDDEFAINTMAAAAEMPVEWWHDMARLVKELVQKMNKQK